MKARDAILRFIAAAGAAIGYGCFLAFLYLVGVQVYGWFKDGEWTHIGLAQGLRAGLIRCCVKDGDNGRFATFLHWLDAPGTWLGLHKVLEAMPASLALFAVSIAGNCVFTYCRDRLDRR
jgi:hypothetical protein